MKYQVEYTDSRTGATSAIDTITAAEGYTAEQYIEDCRENADQEWIDMLEQGTVELIELPETLFTGYKDGQKVTVTLEDHHVWIETFGERELWNDEYYTEESISTIKLSLLNEGYRI